MKTHEAYTVCAPMRKEKDPANTCSLCGAVVVRWDRNNPESARDNHNQGKCELPTELRKLGFQCEQMRMNWTLYMSGSRAELFAALPLVQRPPIGGLEHGRSTET